MPGFDAVQFRSDVGRGVPTAPVSIVVPTYNRAEFLPAALTSLLQQTVRPDLIVVVDDGSTDGTAEAAARFGNSVDYVRKQNGGKSSAINHVLAGLRSDFIWIFDDDDLAAPFALQSLLSGFATAPDAGFSYSSYRLFQERRDGTIQFTDRDFPHVQPDGLFVALLGRSFVHQPGLLVRRCCYDVVGPFDESLIRSQDYDMMLRLARQFRGVEVPGPVFFQRQHDGPRGTGRAPIPPSRINAAWKAYDQRILRRLRPVCGLAEYLPDPAAVAPLTPQQEFSALLERCTVFGRKGLWADAADDIAAAIRIANDQHFTRLTLAQMRTLHRMFDVFSMGAEEFPQAHAFQQALSQIRHPVIARKLRQAMSWGLPHRIRLAAADGRYAELLLLTQIFVSLASPRSFASSFARKLLAKLRPGRI